ncbi:ABC transporter permease [Limnovirga soli]|uniref:FtsX-like permease family protein n=1 Tax=Limnovirga soli TaxID=2656915 RepID=A0A8J8FJD0_9BACT|nr:ABC transporter permease [Limnovirga soli]NNV56926.1 FtsX-like permease family protein [Limnovirga soli]
MFKNYFKTAWRNIRANKLFTVLNIAGLAIGLCVFILLFAHIANELSFDRMYTNGNNIYRVNMETTAQYNSEQWAELPNAVGPAMLKDIPQVKSFTRLVKNDFGATASLKVGDKNFVENGLYLADASVFTVFDFSFEEGTIAAAFTQPNSIVISTSAKERLFGNQQAMGKTIAINNRDTVYVSGVYKDLPVNSTIDCDMIYNIMDSWMGQNVSWSNASFETYCLLQPTANIASVQQMATGLINKYVPKDEQYYTRFMLQPLADIHLYSTNLRQGYSAKMGSITTIKSLLFLSLLILLIACINYMNLATARSQKRAKGVGVNKVLGANIKQMLMHFYTETGILTFISIAMGYALAIILLPFFRNITGSELNNANLYSTPILLSLVLVWLLVTMVAGSYPAISMSRISPLILMNKSKQKHSLADLIRKSLVVFQFACSIILIIAVMVIYQQLQYITNKNLGYNPKGIIAVSIKSAENDQQINTAITDIKNLAVIENVSVVQSIPGETESGRSVRKLATDKEGFPVKTCRTDGAITETMQLQLLAGNPLPKSLSQQDTTCYVLINETVAKYLGYKTPQEAVGKNVISEMSENASVITGVVKNFNYQSLKDDIGGYVYYEMNRAPEYLRTLLVRYNTQNLPQLVQQLEGVFKNDLPNTAFDYKFLDTHIQNRYAAETKTANTITVFSLLAIFIACLGLFGLAAFTAEQRTKEIGIRKVLGASLADVSAMLSKDFLQLVLIAAIIAFPVAWWAMQQWLQNFAFKIDISWWVFLLAGLAAIIIALITVSFQSIKAAIANPVKSLRTE